MRNKQITDAFGSPHKQDLIYRMIYFKGSRKVLGCMLFPKPTQPALRSAGGRVAKSSVVGQLTEDLPLAYRNPYGF